MSKDHPFRNIPPVDQVMDSSSLKDSLSRIKREIVKRVIQEEIKLLKVTLSKSKNPKVPTADELALMTAKKLDTLTSPLLSPVVNATGIILHTNLGRALLTKKTQAGQAAMPYPI